MPSPLSFAVVSGIPSAERHLRALAEALEQILSREVEAKVLSSYADLEDAVARGQADIAWAPPFVAMELEEKGLATLALCCSRSGQVAYHTALFTQHTSRLEKLGDLRGTHVAWVDKQSSGGYLVARGHLAEQGLEPSTLFGKESFLGTHEKVSTAVLDGEVDVGATYLSLDPVTNRPLSAGWLEAGAAVNAAFILAIAGPIPADLLVVAKKHAAAEQSRIIAALAELPKKVPASVGRLLRADGFAPPVPAHFERLRALARS